MQQKVKEAQNILANSQKDSYYYCLGFPFYVHLSPSALTTVFCFNLKSAFCLGDF
jgi:hypothetical protein